MIRLFVRHEVADYDAWRREYDAFDEVRTPMGVLGDAVYRSTENPNEVTVWHDFDSVESAEAFGESDELRAAMGRSGVQGQPQVWLTSPA